jgi:hypothetical protein
MEICSIDISAATDRLNLLCRAAAREIMGRNAGGDWQRKIVPFIIVNTKDRYK